jgi:hypothetical protein
MKSHKSEKGAEVVMFNTAYSDALRKREMKVSTWRKARFPISVN